MNPQAEELNQIIRQKSTPVFEMLSERGKNIFFPKKGILGQTAEAKGTRINATIGAAIEDDGSPMRLETIASKINLDPSLVFPYAPSFGRPDLRSKWKSMIYGKNPSLGKTEISSPVVTNALTHGISMAGYLFADAGDEVIVPSLFWGNYNLTLANGYGANLVTFNLFKDGGFDVDAFEAKLNEGPIGKKILILNFPNNPSGYTPTQKEVDAIISIIGKAAVKGNKLVCITDDAYFGLVYEKGIAQESIFAPLASLHENVLAVKLDGATKEDYVWGFRVGFITYATKGGDAELYGALESKTAGAIRGNISNAANISQSLMYVAYNSDEYALQKQAKFQVMQQRYVAVKEALKDEKYKKYFTALPFNSGYFMCVQLAEGLDSEKVRQTLINKYSIGTISLNGILRLAFSAVASTNVKEMFEGIYKACEECS
ncbi:aminotransferase class I/II-fold pyridoxal phosphate-dependent enzyme [Mariniphaga sediminis]|uniref:Aminotransferase class I/II-fold pyridoxal phosphate-dependent enzyme n=1 Tax=Mariniphaga sediminis TaxID=1628158 RepID=A0A399D4R5_9BACT|nr:aminotransferase class I/II-fold pyridoxal phosphate-dependent enzyme [Mariniphaga sediminis]RIH66649.1 aminotransferase class I/II-fold pyridoxal phosphate-dependent enzyme [Mariniphaga sediminis]